MHQHQQGTEQFGKIRAALDEAESTLLERNTDPSLAQGQDSDRKCWEQQTVYLPPDLRHWLRVYAVETQQEMSSIAAEALQEYRAKQQRGSS